MSGRRECQGHIPTRILMGRLLEVPAFGNGHRQEISFDIRTLHPGLLAVAVITVRKSGDQCGVIGFRMYCSTQKRMFR